MDLLERPTFLRDQQAMLERVAGLAKGLVIVTGAVRAAPHGRRRKIANAAVVLAEGQIAFAQDKTLLPTYDVFDERRYFEPGDSWEPLEIAGHRIGITICEDVWQRGPR